MDLAPRLDGMVVELENLDSQYDWYERYLGIRRDLSGSPTFTWRHAASPERSGNTRWDVFAKGTDWRDPSKSEFDWVRFGWITDPEDGRLESEETTEK